MSDMIGSALNPMESILGTNSSIDMSKAGSQASDLWNQIYGNIQPSQASIDQVSKMQNDMGNQFYNQGISGSTIANQALGEGETEAFDKDQMAQASQIMKMMLPFSAQQYMHNTANARTLGELGGLAGDASMMGLF